MKILEAISFGVIALSLHITVISFFVPEVIGSKQKEEDGERETITLSSLSLSTSDSIKALIESEVLRDRELKVIVSRSPSSSFCLEPITSGTKKEITVMCKLNAITPKLIASNIFIWWSHWWDH